MPAAAVAAIGGAATIGGALIGSSATKKAARTQADAAKYAADQTMAQFQQTREDMAPWRQYGGGAMDMLAQIYQIPWGSAGAAGATGGTGKTPGGFAGTSPMAPQQDWNAYLASNPDVQARAQQGMASGEIGPNGQWKTPAEWAAFQYQNSGQAEGRTAPPNLPQQAGQPGANRFGGFFESPDYQFRQDEQMRAVEGSAAARGSLNSGGALKAITRYSGNIASGEWNNYVNRLASIAGVGQSANYQTGQLGAAAAGHAGDAMMAGAGARASGYLANGQTWGNALGQLGGIAGGVINGGQNNYANAFSQIAGNSAGAGPAPIFQAPVQYNVPGLVPTPTLPRF